MSKPNPMFQIRICTGCGRDTKSKTELCTKCRTRGKANPELTQPTVNYPTLSYGEHDEFGNDDYSENSRP
jgi:hypothetical protein